MDFKEYYIEHNNKSNCVIRTFTKLFNYEYEDIYNELLEIANKLNCNYNDVEIFEEYLTKHNYKDTNLYKDELVRNLKLDNSNYVVFCYDKKDRYHMFPIINNTIYDKNKDCFNLYVIKIYKEGK